MLVDNRWLFSDSTLSGSVFFTIIAAISAWLAWSQDNGASDCNDIRNELSENMVSAQLTQIVVRQIVIENEIRLLRYGQENLGSDYLTASKRLNDKSQFIVNRALKTQVDAKRLRLKGKAICDKAATSKYWSQFFSIIIAMLATLSTMNLVSNRSLDGRNQKNLKKRTWKVRNDA